MAKILILLYLATFCSANEEKTALAVQNRFYKDRIPIAVVYRNFTQFVYGSQIFSDKSLLIKEAIEETSKTIIITCPGRWGKSVNIHMIRTFLAMNADDHGNPVLPLYLNRNYRMFVYGEFTVTRRYDPHNKLKWSNATVFLDDPLLIAGHQDIIEKHLCKYPVLYVDFCVTRSAKNHQELMREFKNSLAFTFAEHKYMRNVFNDTLNGNTTDADLKTEAREGLRLFHHFAHDRGQMSLNDVIDCLKFLSGALHRRFNKSVYVIIDDYDLPWSNMLIRDWSPEEEVRDFLYFYSAFMEATINKNRFLEKAILTGKLAPPTELRKLVFKQITECSPVTGKWMEYYGIADSLAKHILEESRIPEYISARVPTWYDGYKMNHVKVRLYNPGSFGYYMTAFQRPRKRMKLYWVHGENDAATFVDNCLKIEPVRKKLRSLIYRQNVLVKYIRQFKYRQLQYLYRVWQVKNYTIRYDDQFTDQAIMFLYIQGHLTLSHDVDSTTCQDIRLRIPNAEIAFVMRLRFLDYYEEQLGLTCSYLFPVRIMWKSRFDHFTRNNELDGTKLAKSFMQYLKLYSSYEKEILTMGTHSRREEALNKILTYLLIDINSIRKDEIIATPYLPATDALIVYPNRTVIVSLQFARTTAPLVCNEAREHIKIVHQRNYPMNEIKIVGVNIYENSTVQVCSNLII